ncbi:hypothetical protein PoB_002422300 [Plakobranchus ocellatus]|uniref:Uncharacterized protein n=1 Tax=Plakobranchus ocellatus TaxID=259542 RepID=A0AAV3ZTD3_9GAST|nr:hypothetical protein PoB_002422300 [Plakobranchus ocellatus]
MFPKSLLYRMLHRSSEEDAHCLLSYSWSLCPSSTEYYTVLRKKVRIMPATYSWSLCPSSTECCTVLRKKVRIMPATYSWSLCPSSTECCTVLRRKVRIVCYRTHGPYIPPLQNVAPFFGRRCAMFAAILMVLMSLLYRMLHRSSEEGAHCLLPYSWSLYPSSTECCTVLRAKMRNVCCYTHGPSVLPLKNFLIV